jgi:hypothetical protein
MAEVFTRASVEFMGRVVAAAAELAEVVLELSYEEIHALMFSMRQPALPDPPPESLMEDAEDVALVSTECARANEYLHRDRHEHFGAEFGLRGREPPPRCTQLHISLSFLVHMLCCDTEMVDRAKAARE